MREAEEKIDLKYENMSISKMQQVHDNAIEVSLKMKMKI